MVDIEPILLQIKSVAHNKNTKTIHDMAGLPLSKLIKLIQVKTITRTRDDDGSSRGACVDRTDRGVADACDEIDSE